MTKYNIEYSKEAKQDLIGIKQYIKYNLIVNNYIVFYRIKKEKIEIVRIMYGRRNWINLL